MFSISMLLLLLALICFVLSALSVPATSRVNLQSLGLALWVLALLVGGR